MKNFEEIVHFLMPLIHKEDELEYKAQSARLHGMSAHKQGNSSVSDILQRMHCEDHDIKHTRKVEHQAHDFWTYSNPNDHPTAVLEDEPIETPKHLSHDRKASQEHCISEPGQSVVADFL
jgi:hypothetical protein